MKLKAIYWNFYFSFYPLQACPLVSHSIRWRFSIPVLDEELRYKIFIKMTFNDHFKSLLPCLPRSIISDSTWIWVSLLIIILSFCKFLGSILLFDVLKVHIDVSRHRFFSFMLHPFILKTLPLSLGNFFFIFFFLIQFHRFSLFFCPESPSGWMFLVSWVFCFMFWQLSLTLFSRPLLESLYLSKNFVSKLTRTRSWNFPFS